MAFSDISRDVREMNAIDQFINGLSSYGMKKLVQFAHPKSLDEAITLAIEFEAFDGPADSKKLGDQFSVQAIKEVVSFENEDPVLKPEASVAGLF